MGGYLAASWSGFDAQVLEVADNAADSMNTDLNTSLLISTLVLGITVGMSLELPDPCDDVNLFGTCEATTIALTVHRTAAMACNVLCIVSMLIGGHLLQDLGRVPGASAKTFIINALPALGAKKLAYELAIWAFTLTMIMQLLITLGSPQALGCLVLLLGCIVVVQLAKANSQKAADDAIASLPSYSSCLQRGQPHPRELELSGD
eukprot:CAMPEP_0204579784 /NCGR_PEP_ID=MMETSP0661-20131031/43695_1 /ASSEMBLY_ACC=CAM_ASM_000606 /TAXON_ID=109239 /ORGANISM="Alexandrium margalefi, Strain AMGDE01CS-322" /LENGTH=204 /DNA_ID=CAMNT_0051588833 /DNA_START=42 /DNA_END=656 /DNA_ORIENTATION=+